MALTATEVSDLIKKKIENFDVGVEARTEGTIVTLTDGIDGLDPDILKSVVERYPDKMVHFAELMGEADGARELGTATPPQSPVAWSNFIVGTNPGGHQRAGYLRSGRRDGL